MHDLHRRLRRATGLGAVALLARAARRAGGRLPRAALRELQQRPRRRPPRRSRCAPCSTTAAAARRSRPASLRFNVDSRPPDVVGLGLDARGARRARSSAPSRAISPARARCACSRTARTRAAPTSAPASTCPASTASIIGDDNLVFVIRRTTSGAHLTFTLDVQPRGRQARGQGRPLDAADGHARAAQLDPLRRQEPRHHAQPGQPDRAHELGHRPLVRRSGVR